MNHLSASAMTEPASNHTWQTWNSKGGLITPWKILQLTNASLATLSPDAALWGFFFSLMTCESCHGLVIGY